MRAFWRTIGVLLASLAVASCVSLPVPTEPPPPEFAQPPADSGVLARMEASIAAEHGADHSGFHLLDRSVDALTWRLALVDSAQATLDVVYYIWWGDDVGRLMVDRLVEAAQRGVKVRLLVDDLVLVGKDKGLVALDSVPNLELRLFNPKWQRKVGMVADSLMRFGQMNQRMHNKLIVADNRALILGGRNIGNEYFGLKESFDFHDLDVMGFGPVARDGSALFDNFWNSEWSVPVAGLPYRMDDDELARRREQLTQGLQASEVLDAFPLEPQDWSGPLEGLLDELHVGVGTVIHDRMEGTEIVRGMVDPIREVLRSAGEEIKVVNAYIIPSDAFVDGLRRITGEGVDVGILTNSLSSHDTPAVNSHYKKWRKPLIEAGAALYELRSDPAIRAQIQTPPVTMKHAGLHTKSVVVDGERVFIGSFNFDPRSKDINTEMGMIIDSPGLGQEMVALFERDTSPENAWQVRLHEDGALYWVNSDETVTRQPARSWWQRVQDAFFVLLPVSQF